MNKIVTFFEQLLDLNKKCLQIKMELLKCYANQNF